MFEFQDLGVYKTVNAIHIKRNRSSKISTDFFKLCVLKVLLSVAALSVISEINAQKFSYGIKLSSATTVAYKGPGTVLSSNNFKILNFRTRSAFGINGSFTTKKLILEYALFF